jgi:hypothetical protein
MNMLNENNAIEMAAALPNPAEQSIPQASIEPTPQTAPQLTVVPPEASADVPNPALIPPAQAAETTLIASAAPVEAPVIPEPAPATETISDAPEPTPESAVETVPAPIPALVPEPRPLEPPVIAPVPPVAAPQPPKPKEESIFRPVGDLSADKEKGVENLAELSRLEVLRTELASSAFKPKVILSYETISFNKACVNLMPNTRYVNVLVDRTKKRIIILPVNRHAKDALQWCGVTPKGDVKKKVCTARKFGEKMYEMMEWVKEYKYRILAYYQQIDGVELLVFNLLECEMVVPELVTTKTGKVMRRGRAYLPGDIVGFGMPLDQHKKANDVELAAHYTLSDKDVDVTISGMQVKGKVPTDEEIIMSQYRKERAQEVYING